MTQLLRMTISPTSPGPSRRSAASTIATAFASPKGVPTDSGTYGWSRSPTVPSEHSLNDHVVTVGHIGEDRFCAGLRLG